MMTDTTFSYLIIGGTTKSATTSVFNYLADHPDVCASSWKETRFFLDSDYPVDIPFSLDKDGFEKYGHLFNRCLEKKFRMEATPDYLYSPGTPARIRSTIPDARFIFLLREPVSRLVSWYRFALQRNTITGELSFDEYIHRQMDGGAPRLQSFLALEQGCYSRYLENFFAYFDRSRIFVGFLEDLQANPLSFMQQICAFAGLPDDFYAGYQFKQFNQSDELKNPQVYGFYLHVKRFLRRFTYEQPYHRYLKKIGIRFEELYLRLDRKESEKSGMISTETKALLRNYYKDESQKLSSLLGRTIPWGDL
jgi:hypothetical protein